MSTAYAVSRKARAIKLATFRSSSTKSRRIRLAQYHRTTQGELLRDNGAREATSIVGPSACANSSSSLQIIPNDLAPNHLLDFEDQNIGVRRSVLRHSHEIPLELRHQEPGPPHSPGMDFPK